MTLHMLYRTNRLKDCLALATATDTLLVMEPSVLESIKDHIPTMPCPVLLLCDGASKDHSTASEITQIDVDEWVRLVAERPHSMVWD